MNILTVYHGSADIIETPEYGKGKPYNDYGRGFYCTQSEDLAKEWAVADGRDGYANKYSLDMTGLKLLDLSESKYNVLNWMTLLIQNRVFTLKSDISKLGKTFLISHFSLSVEDFDVIKGYRADDSYFAYAESFLDNTISVQRLSEALRLGELGEQIVLTSKKAFENIKFLGFEFADSATYYHLRRERNEKARLQFLSNRRGTPSPDDIYLSDIIRGANIDDTRL